MNSQLIHILSVFVFFLTACNLNTSSGEQSTPTSLPTLTPYPTYTPYPTLASETYPDAASTASSAADVTSSAALLSDIMLTPNKPYGGTTKYTDNLLYFMGQEGQTVSMMLVGNPKYQFFSIRDDKNKGLIGCDVVTSNTCALQGFKLPYTGVYYVLVDRTLVENYKKYPACTKKTPYPDYCYRGGPYNVTLSTQ